ncbi:hypothetical protein [Bacillus toyonensis]|uniref:hypothetical protein n=1 Tax=Bacillus toyonensis TaxID=155322 RepID=UPI002E23C846|nr:hypothetical protein [Bacillus toyonensis]
MKFELLSRIENVKHLPVVISKLFAGVSFKCGEDYYNKGKEREIGISFADLQKSLIAISKSKSKRIQGHLEVFYDSLGEVKGQTAHISKDYYNHNAIFKIEISNDLKFEFDAEELLAVLEAFSD